MRRVVDFPPDLDVLRRSTRAGESVLFECRTIFCHDFVTRSDRRMRSRWLRNCKAEGRYVVRRGGIYAGFKGGPRKASKTLNFQVGVSV